MVSTRIYSLVKKINRHWLHDVQQQILFFQGALDQRTSTWTNWWIVRSPSCLLFFFNEWVGWWLPRPIWISLVMAVHRVSNSATFEISGPASSSQSCRSCLASFNRRKRTRYVSYLFFSKKKINLSIFWNMFRRLFEPGLITITTTLKKLRILVQWSFKQKNRSSQVGVDPLAHFFNWIRKKQKFFEKN